ncbi:MAG: hypothetical protein OEV73_07585 [Desulfobulbaceae bacterium]|nr:hypothetical protein [Desulfobulbaceae bacterium]
MATLLDYAALSVYIYRDARGTDNRNPLPPNWSQIGYIPGGGLNGFTAGAYKNGTDIVIAFKGTDTSLSGLINAAGTVADVTADLALGAGFGSTQLFQAALFYQQVKSANPDANITFTGHSLGGGLASIMSVWFNRAATTFDEAPFEVSALNPLLMAAVSGYLGLNGYADSDFLSFIFSYPVTYGGREAQVTNNFVKGEALETLRAAWPTVLGTDKPIVIGGGASLSGLTLHSINLAAALLIQDKLRADTVLLPNLLPAIFDEALYAKPLSGDKADFLTALLNDQIKVGYDNADGLLARFSSDIAKLTNYGANLKDGTLGKALIDVAIADYYFMQSGFTKDFFTTISDGVSFDLKDIGTDWPSNKTVKSLDDAIIQYIHGDQVARQFIAQDNAWTIQSGDTTLNATGTGANNDAMIGGSSDDALDGGSGNDFLYGGDGNDTLTGGADDDMLMGGTGDDVLRGGAGYDTYVWHTGDGNDTITDQREADGKVHGTIKIVNDQGQDVVVGGAYVPQGTSEVWVKTLPDGSGELTISHDSQWTLTMTDGSALTLGDFKDGDFGISLVDDTDPVVSSEDVLEEIHADAQGNPVRFLYGGSAGDYLEGDGRSEFIYGNEGADLIMGGSGSDAMLGGDGNDRIFADQKQDISVAYLAGETGTGTGASGDLLQGDGGDDELFAGADNDGLVGGAGSDLIYAGAGDDIVQGDGIVDPGSVTTANIGTMLPSSPTEGEADVIYAGVGADTVYAQGGDDFVDAGSGNDKVWGDGGNDIILGQAGDDVLVGDNSIDILPAEYMGDDYIEGGDGDDQIWGLGGSDELIGGAGNDKLDGDSDDTPVAFQGGDYLDGGDGNDQMTGYGGEDILIGGAENGHLEGGCGNDWTWRIAA